MRRKKKQLRGIATTGIIWNYELEAEAERQMIRGS